VLKRAPQQLNVQTKNNLNQMTSNNLQFEMDFHTEAISQTF